jgi:uncharacterized protein YndB with AHSA1/START domain
MVADDTTPHVEPNDSTGRPHVADTEIVITRVIDAPREIVYEAFTTPVLAKHWWGPKDSITTELEFDARPGSAWHARIRSAEGDEHPQRGIVRDVATYSHLAFTFVSDDDPNHQSLVDVRLADVGDRTEVVFQQGPFESADSRDSHRAEWNESLDRLDEFLRAKRR